jgi:hypothetical protein
MMGEERQDETIKKLADLIFDRFEPIRDFQDWGITRSEAESLAREWVASLGLDGVRPAPY